MHMKNANFINTTDEQTAETLRSLGFKELPKSGNRYVFINDNKMMFSSDDMKINYTDVLTF